MSFDFNLIPPQNPDSISLRSVSVQAPQKVQGAEFAGVNVVQEKPLVDSFTKTDVQNTQTVQTQGFQEIYQNYYNAQKINNALSPAIQDICNNYSINSKVTPEQVINIGWDHIKKTYEYAAIIGNRMGLTQNEKEDLKMASILHDIGKAYIPTEILNKPDLSVYATHQ